MSRQSILLSVLAAVLVIALWWLFVFTPGQDQLETIQTEIDAAQNEQSSLEQRIAALESVRSRAPEIEAAIARVQSIVPSDPALAAALRQIVAAAEDAGVDIEALNATRPAGDETEADALGLFTQNLNLTVTGSYFQVVDFVRRIEDPQITARGIVFNNLTMAVSDYPDLTVALTGRMFSVLDPVPEPAAEGEAAEDAAAEDADAATDDASPADEGEAS